MKTSSGNGDARSCRLVVDGIAMSARDGQTVAAAMIGHGLWVFGRHPLTGVPRGPFCGMGVCFECELEVDGQRDVRACMVHVHDGMSVRTGT